MTYIKKQSNFKVTKKISEISEMELKTYTPVGLKLVFEKINGVAILPDSFLRY